MGIGYNTESNNAPPSNPAPPARSAAVNSLRTGMMGQFKSSFVAAASSHSPSHGSNSPANQRPVLRGFVSGGSIGPSASSHSNPRPALRGFVSGGSIGGDGSRSQTTHSTVYAPASDSVQNPIENATRRDSERLVIPFQLFFNVFTCINFVIRPGILKEHEQ